MTDAEILAAARAKWTDGYSFVAERREVLAVLDIAERAVADELTTPGAWMLLVVGSIIGGCVVGYLVAGGCP